MSANANESSSERFHLWSEVSGTVREVSGSVGSKNVPDPHYLVYEAVKKNLVVLVWIVLYVLPMAGEKTGSLGGLVMVHDDTGGSADAALVKDQA